MTTARSGAGSTALRLAGVLAIAVMLRPSIAGVGPIIDDIRDGLGLPSAAVSLLTTLPILCFAAGSLLVPVLVGRLGVDRTAGLALALLAVALLVRVADGPGVLFTATTLSGLAIAVSNVLLPRIVKTDFAGRAGLITGLYTSTLSVAASLSALLAVPLERWTGDGWRGSLFTWGLVAVLAFLVWTPQLAHRRIPVVGAVTEPVATRTLLRNRRAIALTAFMGLQSLSFYVCLSWLPLMLQDDAGVSHTAAGAYLSLLTGLGIPMSLIISAIAVRQTSQRSLAVGCTALVAIGFLGLLLAPHTATVLWVVMLGIGTGSTFPLTLLLMVLRASTPEIAGQLSAMAQGIGYLICAVGPFVVGVVHDATDSWKPSLVIVLALVGLQAVSGAFAGRAGVAA